MSERKQPMPHPFQYAQRVPAVVVSLRIVDVLRVRPNWTQEQAQAFLARHSSLIAEAMLWAGGATVAKLLEGHDYAN
jgi:hypothetical protein